MKKYDSNRAQRGKTAFRTPRSFIGKVTKTVPKRVEHSWGLAERLQHVKKEK